jgi:hypothetical protein
MRKRLILAGVTAFWLVMNYLLYRSQWGTHGRMASPVPLAVVWQKILTAPDPSSLDIYNGDKKVGYGRWLAGTANSLVLGSKLLASEYQPGGSPARPEEYGLMFEGSAVLGESNRLRFQGNITLDTNRNWRDFRASASLRPSLWSLTALASQQTVVLKGDDDNGVWTKTWRFADLDNPQTWLGDFVDTNTLAFLGLNRSLAGAGGAGMEWEAHEDRMSFGGSKLRVYRLDSSVLGQHFEVVVSRIGEILWVELPFHITLRNQALSLSP